MGCVDEIVVELVCLCMFLLGGGDLFLLSGF